MKNVILLWKVTVAEVDALTTRRRCGRSGAAVKYDSGNIGAVDATTSGARRAGSTSSSSTTPTPATTRARSSR